ncbi:uncharacterized protein LOC123467128 [Daphnia magna]|uniref:uncharacterized protein LOC123467128 n=1 Tax=Daphnia magna TaxID=35525 RepID=UPI001E1BA7F6|nr:uncharacterized protein LOC123467128 [Daphnia magna]
MTSTSKQDGENISKDVSHIPKFNGKNYPSWKYGVWLLFRQHELTDIVENKVSKPEEVKDESGVVTNEAAITAWNRKDILATCTDKDLITLEEAIMFTEGTVDSEVVGEVHQKQKEEGLSAITVKKKVTL